MKGRRVYPNAEGFIHFDEGDYGQTPTSEWFVRPPGVRAAGSIRNHTVTEHQDGTITVEPSILVEAGAGGQYHGYLRRGEWTESM